MSRVRSTLTDIQVCQKGDYWSKSAPNGKSSLELLYNDWPCSNYATTSYTPTDWTWQGSHKEIKVVCAENQNPRVLECKSLNKACLNGGLCVLFRKNCECTCTHIKHGGIYGRVIQRNSWFCSYHLTFQVLKVVTRIFASPPLLHMMFSVRGHSHAIEKVFMCMNILKSPKHTKTATLSQEISNFSKTEL